jgi:CheY-like chemotaxis protein
MEVLTFKTVLVAEDDSFARRVLVTALERMGAHVYQSENGEHAISLLSERKVDLALLDLLMPKVNGLCVLQAIRAGMTLQDFALPAVLLTASRDEASLYYASALSCNGFLLKPITNATLGIRLSKVVTERMNLPYVPQHYRRIDVGPPDRPPSMPTSRTDGLGVAELQVGMIFSAPVISLGRSIAPIGTPLTAELLALLQKLDKVAPLDPVFVAAPPVDENV